MQYVLHILIMISIYLVFAQSFNFIFGLGGLLTLAHVSSFAIGAYSTAILTTKYDLNFGACLLASMFFSGFFSLLIGAISARLEKDYFIIGSLAFGSIVSALLINWRSLTNGVLGIAAIPKPRLASIDFYQNQNFLMFSASIALLSLFFLNLLFNSSFARQLRSLAEYEPAALALATNTPLVKNISFFIASCFAGLAGAELAFYLSYIDPSSFGMGEMVFALTAVVIGKPGYFWGTVFATVFLFFLPEALRFVNLDPGILGPMRQFLYALILFVVIFIRRATIFPSQRTV